MKIWYRKKAIICLCIAFICYLLFRCRKYNVTFSATIANAKPVEVWEFVSDFNNMKKLNPTILDFSIESESGNYNHWKYRVYYTEYLAQLPFLTNFAWADFNVKTEDNKIYSIYSSHRTCFITSLFCVHTDSIFTVQSMQSSSESKYTESITYECPLLFSSFTNIKRNLIPRCYVFFSSFAKMIVLH